jgi:hypothetical protein
VHTRRWCVGATVHVMFEWHRAGSLVVANGDAVSDSFSPVVA